MKMVIAIMSNDDGPEVIRFLNKKGFEVSRLNTTAGLLRSGNTTLLCAVEDEDVDDVVEIIRSYCFQREEFMENIPAYDINSVHSHSINVPTGGAKIFVVPVEQYIKV